MYADDTAIYFSHSDAGLIQRVLREDFGRVSEWLSQNKLTLNAKKTKCILFGTPAMLSVASPLSLSHNNTDIERVSSFKYLGVAVDCELNFQEHLSELTKKIASRIGALGRIRKYIR